MSNNFNINFSVDSLYNTGYNNMLIQIIILYKIIIFLIKK